LRGSKKIPLPDLAESQIIDISHQIQKSIQGQLRTDLTVRMLYSTDASIYQIEPLGVIFPRVADDLNAIVEICASFHSPVIVRGAGSGLAGQAIGRGWIVDCSRYLNRLLEIDPETRTALVEPGLVLNTLNREAARYGLQFGPDPASAERATLGGSLANNASGAHSIRYGMSADHLLGVEAVLSDGSTAQLEEIRLEQAERRLTRIAIMRHPSIERLYPSERNMSPRSMPVGRVPGAGLPGTT
jgi:FAD/FMN-containing dehydrogenase